MSLVFCIIYILQEFPYFASAFPGSILPISPVKFRIASFGLRGRQRVEKVFLPRCPSSFSNL